METACCTGKGTAMPEWFSGPDIDGDGQIALRRMAKGSRDHAYMEMDLDGDGY